MTNLVAAILVSIVTNSVDVFPTFNAPSSPPITLDQNGVPEPFTYAVAYFETRPVPNPKTKLVVTTCKEVTVLKFDWNGPREIVSEKILWQTNQLLRLEWK